jgi:coatomer subunit beta
VFALASIYTRIEHLIPDAPEILYDFISKETDMSCKRNAFHMLYQIDQPKAVHYLVSTLDKVPTFDEHLQMAVVDLIHKDCRNNLTEKVRTHIKP